MASIDVYKSNIRNTEEAFSEATSRVGIASKMIIFFASTIYNYEQLVSLFHQKYPNSTVVGLTTVGEINKQGIEENSLTVTAFTGNDLKVNAVMLKDIHKFPIFQRQQLIEAASKTGISLQSKSSRDNSFAIVIPNGLINAEERMLSIVNSIFEYEGFPVFGGTAGDDAKFEHTYTSLNNEASSTAGIVVFVKLQNDFKIYKESIFKPFSDEVLVATKVDVEGRKVYEFNGRKAATEYARVLGISESALESKFMAHPLGFVGKQLSVGSPMCVNADKSISFYCQIARNSEMKMLKPLDVLETMETTTQQVLNDFKQIEATFVVNCILRKIQFKNTNMLHAVNDKIMKLGPTFGFCSYGEQLQNEQINQTMVLLVIGTANGVNK